MPKNYRCPGCGNTVEFFPETGKMYCAYCGNTVDVKELAEKENKKAEQKEDHEKVTEAEKLKERKRPTIQMQILHCKSCGAELAVNDVEASSFCAYCGQATVVLDRVDEYLRPDYVMPFSVTKDQAESTIRAKISSGFYVPDEIKHFEIEKLRGIYVPFWLYDVYYGDEQYWKYTVKRGKSSVTRYSYRLAESEYHQMTLDASKNLNDNSSQRLEPYHVEGLREFEPMYLSGFYADRFDVGLDDTRGLAFSRAKEMFDAEVKRTIQHSGAKMVYSHPVTKVTDTSYALLPVWFLTFRNEGFPYTVLVNGQTGKMVGAVPCVKAKAWATFVILAVLLCAVLTPLGAVLMHGLFRLEGKDSGKMIAYALTGAALAIAWFWSRAIRKYNAFKESVALTRSGTTSRFVRERQGM